MYSLSTFSSAGDKLYVRMKGGSVPGFRSIAWSVSRCGANLLAFLWLKNFGNFLYRYSGTSPPWQSRKIIFPSAYRAQSPELPIPAWGRALALELPFQAWRCVAVPKLPYSGWHRVARRTRVARPQSPKNPPKNRGRCRRLGRRRSRFPCLKRFRSVSHQFSQFPHFSYNFLQLRHQILGVVPWGQVSSPLPFL
jgi:hypothetical protein